MTTRFSRSAGGLSAATVAGLALLCGTAASLAGKPAPTTIEFRVNRCLPVTPHKTLQLRTGEETFLDVELPRMNFSKVYRHRGSRKLVFGTTVKTGDQTRFTPLASALVPENLKKVLLVFLPAGSASKSGLPYRVAVIDASAVTFRGGSAYYFNLSRFPIAGQLGDRPLRLRPGASTRIRARPGKRYYVDIRYQKDNKWFPLCKSYWEDDPDFRQVVLIYDDPKSRRTRFLSIAERTPAE